MSTNFVSRDNPDPSARNMGRALDQAGFSREEVALWNVVPYCVSSATINRNATAAQVRGAVVETQQFVDCFSSLTAAVFCGRSAQRAMRLMRFPNSVRVFATFHPASRSYSRKVYRDDIEATFRDAKRSIQG